MVDKVRYSVGAALGWLVLYLILWIPGSFLVLGLVAGVLRALVPGLGEFLSEPPPWLMALVGGTVVVCGGVHARRYVKRLFDRSPQIELHPTFLRAKQVGEDIFWRDVEDIEGRQTGTGSDEGSTSLVLQLVGGKSVKLDLVGMNMGMKRLFGLACAARERDREQTQASEAIDSPHQDAQSPASIRTRGPSTGELGAEVKRFGSGSRRQAIVSIIIGTGILLALPAMGIALDLSKGGDVPSVGTVVLGIMSALIGVPFILTGVAVRRVGLVLFQNGLTYVGPLRRHALLYDNILRLSVISMRPAGQMLSKPVAIELYLRDGRGIKLSHLQDVAVAVRWIEELRNSDRTEVR